ncbi:MAG: thioredoxin fold domain-containing protein [Deltaproteobacteria bacterium]|nr:thioredoxin fold domain-containing protein [Deltaproteobacteria bacterium]
MKSGFIQFILIGMALLYPFSLRAETASIEVIESSDTYHAGETHPVIFRINIAEGWYIHGDAAGSGEIIPTRLSFIETPFLKIEDIRFPDPAQKRFEYLTSSIDIFSGDILVNANIVFSADSSPGIYDVDGALSYQACSDNACRPPESVPVKSTIEVVPLDMPSQDINTDLFLSIDAGDYSDTKSPGIFDSNKGVPWILVLIFLGGLALNLSPCIYPMIPITVSYFGGKSGTMKGNTLIHGILYLTGLSVTNSLLGVFSALSGGMLGSVLQHPSALITIAFIMMILGLSFFDLWEIRIPPALNRIASRNFGGYFGTFFMGLTIGIIAAPCIGPFILGLFTYVGQKGDPFFGFLCFFILSMGMGLPICVLALFSGAIKRLPISGDWMLWIRRLMGWVLIAMAAYMISPLVQGTVVRSAIFFVVSIAAGIHLGWLERAGKEIARFRSIKMISGVLIIILGVVFFYSAIPHKKGIKWQPYDESVLLSAGREGKPVILDFYADWCIPCKGLDKTVFGDPEVIDLSKGFIAVRIDLTREQPFQEEVLKRYSVTGVPTVIFINRNGEEERGLRVESIIEASEFLSAMKQALP